MKEQRHSTKKRAARIIVIVFILLLIGFGVWGYVRISQLKEQAATGKALQQELQELRSMKQHINNERNRCQNLLNQESGNFDAFTYCKQFLKWSEELTVTDNKR